MTKDLKIDFENLTLDSFANGNSEHAKEVEDVEINLLEYDQEVHGDLELIKLLPFNNLRNLSIIPGDEDNIYDFVVIDLMPLLKFSALKKVYLEGANLFPFGLSSDWKGKGNFEIETKNLILSEVKNGNRCKNRTADI